MGLSEDNVRASLTSFILLANVPGPGKVCLNERRAMNTKNELTKGTDVAK